MKISHLALSTCLVLLGTGTFAQVQHKMDPPSAAAPAKSESQIAFDLMKTLAGEWDGVVKTDFPGAPIDDIKMHTSMRVTSRGNVLVHEFQQSGTPLDWTKYDHPVTMFYVDEDRLTLVHYCDAGNRPRMTTKRAEGKTIEFALVDVSGNAKVGHMQHAVFTVIDKDHHLEDWTFMLAGDKPVHAVFDLRRAN